MTHFCDEHVSGDNCHTVTVNTIYNWRRGRYSCTIGAFYVEQTGFVQQMRLL